MQQETKKDYVLPLLIFILVVGICASCSYSHLHYSKNYRVRSLQGDTATFYHLEGNYLMDTKKLKKGQKIYIQRTKDSTLANVVRIN